MTQLQRIAGRQSTIAEGMSVLRALPTRERRMVGAWCFLDHLGPLDFAPGQGMHVGAHPHIGLQTFTWLIEGEVLHRDSLGNAQLIRPGQVNLMTAGSGVVHTEDSLQPGQRLHAAQLWIALPPGQADGPASFAHYPELPRWHEAGCDITLLAGRLAGREMLGDFRSPLVGADLHSPRGGTLDLPLAATFEYALLPLEGAVRVAGEVFMRDEFAYLGSGAESLTLELAPGTRLLLLGGEPYGTPVLMWWNFVGAGKEEITRAQHDWTSGSERFGRVEGDEGRRLVAPPLPWAAP